MFEFRTCAIDDEPAATLAQGMRDETAALYDGLKLDGPDMPRAGAAELALPGGAFVVGLDDGVPVCCGGLKRLPDGACEIKKMFVVTDVRGRGVARALLIGLERAAPQELGYAIARLGTGLKQTRARRMYERAGYAPTIIHGAPKTPLLRSWMATALGTGPGSVSTSRGMRYGFRSANAALALIHLTCGPITLTLPHE